MNAEIQLFCEKHVLPKKMINNVLLVVEELLLIHKSLTKEVDINLTLSYSEKWDSLEIVFESSGEEENMLEKVDPDEIGLTIINNIAENIEYQSVCGMNRLTMILKKR